MALLDEVKVACRVSSDAFDTELEAYISAALMDMRRAGVREELLPPVSVSPLAKAAIFQWCKAFYGYDNPEAQRFMESYREILRALLNSRANECDEPDSYDDLRSYMETVES